MAVGALYFRDYSLRSDYYVSRSVTDSSTGGSTPGGFPSSNLFTRPIGQVYKRTGVNMVGGFSCILDFQCVPYYGTWGVGVVGLLNVLGINTAIPGYQEVKVRCQIWSTGIGVGTVWLDQTRIVRPPLQVQVPATHALFCLGSLADTANFAHSGGRLAGSTAVRFTLTGPSANTYDFSVGKFISMQGFPFKNNPRRGLGGFDPSDRQRSYGGQSYVTQRTPLSELSLSGQVLSDEQVFGGSVADPVITWAPYTSTVRAVNSVSGSAEPVLYIPDTSLAANGNFISTGLDTRADDKMVCESFYGLLDQPIKVTEENRVTGSTTTVGGKSAWRLSATLQEIPP